MLKNIHVFLRQLLLLHPFALRLLFSIERWFRSAALCTTKTFSLAAKQKLFCGLKLQANTEQFCPARVTLFGLEQCLREIRLSGMIGLVM